MRRPPPARPRRLVAALAAAALLSTLWASQALADVATPESGSPGADDIDSLYKITLYIGIVIFAGVESALLWSVFKYRYRRDGTAAVQIRGNTRIETGWTVAAALILVGLAAVTFAYLPGIEDPPASASGGLQAAGGVKLASLDQAAPPAGAGKPLTVEVNGQQFIWRYDYPYPVTGGGRVFSYYDLVVPVDTTVVLHITSSDVAHSWWVPKLGGKADAIPGHTNDTWFKIHDPGDYDGACAELCGENHADMRTRVRALPVDDFKAWVAQQAGDIKQAQDDVKSARDQGQGQ